MIETSLALTLLLKATTCLSFGLLAVRLLRRAPASARHLVVATTFASLLFVPIVHLAGPRLDVDVSGMAPVASVDGRRTPPFASSLFSSTGAAGRELTAGTQEVTPPASRSTWRLGDVLAGIWLVGTTCLLLTFILDLLRARRLRRCALPAPEWIRQALGSVGGVHPHRQVEVLVSDDVPGPIVAGVRRPAIVLPLDAESWSVDDLTRAVTHELGHVRRGDWLVQLCARLICTLYWFHPLVWMAWRQLRLEAERACDDEVVAQGPAEDYADQLVSIARLTRSGSHPGILGMAGRSDLSARVRALLDPTLGRGRLSITTATVILLAAVGVLGLIGTVQAVGATREQAGRETVVPSDARLPTPTDHDLFDAASRGEIDRMTRLIADGADVNAVIRGDGSPLIGAARNGQRDAVALLLRGGADPNLGVSFDGSPLIVAAANGHAEIVDQLITAGADPAMAVIFDGNPLIAAARNGHVAIVRTLLDARAPIDDMVPNDETALISASFAGELGAVRLLVERGADVNLRVWHEGRQATTVAGEWRTPLNMARREGHAAVAEYLLSAGARE